MTTEIRFENSINTLTLNDCWLWIKCKDKNGYGVFWNGFKNVRAHRFSYEMYVKKIPKNKMCLHRCDNPSCVNPNHLFLGSSKDNMLDKMKKGRHRTNPTRGSKNPFAKLSEKDVLEIREKYKTDRYFYADLAREYKVSANNIKAIINRIKWKHI